MYRDVSSCNTYNYGDAVYWDARYIQEGSSFDWYQRYSSLRPFVRNYIPPSSTVLMVGCGNAVMSEDMVKDGYEDIMNIDISSVAIDMMRRKYEYIPQLKYMQMDVRDMSFFPDESFDGVIDKGTLDSLMCGTDAPISAAQMLAEVCRLLKPGGTYMLITYGDPTVRMPYLTRSVYNWKITVYNIPRPGFQKPESSSSWRKSYLEPIPLTEKGSLPADLVLEDPDSHYIYVCRKEMSLGEILLLHHENNSPWNLVQGGAGAQIPISFHASDVTATKLVLNARFVCSVMFMSRLRNSNGLEKQTEIKVGLALLSAVALDTSAHTRTAMLRASNQ